MSSGPIYFFTKTNEYFELSNFAPFGLMADGVYWPTVEHYFQAQKFTDAAYRETIRNARSPKDAKTLGQSRKVLLRSDWELVKEQVMLVGLRAKFSSGKMCELLLSTGERELIENSPHDSYWGCGSDGTGRNVLGQLLMQVRRELKAARSA